MSDESSTSLFGSLKRLGDLAVGTVQNRIELFAVELHEEKCRFVQAIMLTAAAIALGVTALTLVTITIVVLYWDTARVAALCVLSGVFVVATVLVLRALQKFLAGAPAFRGTVGELEKDRACLQAKD